MKTERGVGGGGGDSDKEDAFSVPGQIKHLFSDKAVMKLKRRRL